MLRKIRILLACVFFLGITALFLDFTGLLGRWLGWMAQLQFFPAVMAGNVVVVAFFLIVTLLVGRTYCSVICPLGVMQDGFNFVARKVKKGRFHFVPERPWLRWSLLAVFVVLIVFGLNTIAVLIAPYSAYGRIASNLLQPVYVWINNLLASVAERHESYAFYHVDVWVKSGVALAVAIVTLLLVGLLALRRGRTWCNNVCPVGTVLGLVSRVALFRPVIDADRCKNCRKCERNCKASCIDIEHHRIDYSRCVACMDCLEECKFDALQLRNTRFRLNPAALATAPSAEPADGSRRSFMVTAALAGGALAAQAQEKRVDGGLAALTEKQVPVRQVPVRPAGSLSLKHFESHCTSCQLCVSECPNHVLRPSAQLDRLLQPEMSFERGFCRPECTRCSQLCPAGAIRPVSREQKTDIHIGYAFVVQENCLAYTGEANCGNCARHCPAEAITMVSREGVEGLPVPSVNTERCIGCGACEYLCPARPFSAIRVNGYQRHV